MDGRRASTPSCTDEPGHRASSLSTERPIRTCIGCRQRAAAAELLRVVVAPGSVGETMVVGDPSDAAPPVPRVVPDPRRRISGRGAWLHPQPRCAELAQRRRAFSRALRVPGELDSTPVHEYVTAARSDTSASTRTTTASGTPQEMKS